MRVLWSTSLAGTDRTWSSSSFSVSKLSFDPTFSPVDATGPMGLSNSMVCALAVWKSNAKARSGSETAKEAEG